MVRSTRESFQDRTYSVSLPYAQAHGTYLFQYLKSYIQSRTYQEFVENPDDGFKGDMLLSNIHVKSMQLGLFDIGLVSRLSNPPILQGPFV